MRGGGCRHGSGVLSVRGSDCWAAAGGGGDGGRCGQATPSVSDAAGKAVPAGVAGQALPEPYVPGSGDRVPAELRLVLAGYAGHCLWLVRWRLGLRHGFRRSHSWITLPIVLAGCRRHLHRQRYAGDVVRLVLRGALVWGWGGGLGWGCEGRSSAQGAYPVFQAAPAAQRSTHGHGDGLEAWRTHAHTRHPWRLARYQPCPRSASRCGRRPKC